MDVPLGALESYRRLSYSFRKPRATPRTPHSHFPSQVIGVLAALHGGRDMHAQASTNCNRVL